MQKQNGIVEIDGSYSGLSDLIDGDTEKGIEVLSTIVQNIWISENEIAELEKKLTELKGNRTYYKSAISNVCQHLKIKQPFAFLMNDVAVEIDEQTIRTIQLLQP